MFETYTNFGNGYSLEEDQNKKLLVDDAHRGGKWNDAVIVPHPTKAGRYIIEHTSRQKRT